MRRRLREDKINVFETPDMYRGTVAGAVVTVGTIGTQLVNTELGAGAGAVAFKGSIGQTAAATGFYVRGRQSLVFYGTNLSSSGSSASIQFAVTGEDMDGNIVSENMILTTTNVTTQTKPTVNVYRRITSMFVFAIGGTLQANPLIAIGHGVQTADGGTIATRTRLPISAKVYAQYQIAAVLDPNGLPIVIAFDPTLVAQYGYDFARHTIILPLGTTLVVGEYTIMYQQSTGYGDYI